MKGWLKNLAGTGHQIFSRIIVDEPVSQLRIELVTLFELPTVRGCNSEKVKIQF
jgi:hypothetical protein